MIFGWRHTTLALAACILLAVPAGAFAQEEQQEAPVRDRGGWGAVFGDTLSRSGYVNRSIGGPSSPEATLEFDDQKKIGRVRWVWAEGWFDAKRAMDEKTGLQFGINYQAVYLGATAGITDSSQTSSAGGVLNIPITWTPLESESGNVTQFAVAFEDRHTYGYEVSPQNLGFEVGTTLPTAVKFSDVNFRVLVAHFGQSFFGNRAGIVVGKIAPDDYFNHYQLLHPFLNFYGYANSITSTANWPNPGFGIAGGAKLTDQIYFKIGLHDAAGDSFDPDEFLDFGSNFFHGRTFKALEVGWVPSWDQRFVERVAITLVQNDAYEGSEENYAAALATNWTFGRWVPFLLTGVGNGKGAGTLSRATATGGIGHNLRSHDFLAASLNWTKPTGDDLRDQFTVEVFYRVYLSERLAVTPDVQWVINPSLNPNESSILLFGIRARVEF